METVLGAEVTYLFNSGFAVKAEGRYLIFDYYNTVPFKKLPGLGGGVIAPRELKDENVTVFASHAHMDHFVPSIMGWTRHMSRVHYVLSEDIGVTAAARVTKVGPDEVHELDGMTIRTLRSTDEGVAFDVSAGGLRMYHAGDLNWWHWDGEPEEENRAMGEAYRSEIDKLRGITFDIAFVPVDPRLGKEYLWGLDYFMKTADAKVIFPMHFRNTYSMFDKLQKDPMAQAYKDRIVRISRRGEHFEV